MGIYRSLLVFFLLLPACSTTADQQGPLTDQEREAKVDALLAPAVARLNETIGDRRAGVTGFLKEDADYEPRVSHYIAPCLTARLVELGATLVERRDLDRVMEALVQEMSDAIDEDTRVEIGRIAGAELLVLGTVKDLTRSVYRLHLKLMDLETGKILLSAEVDIPRSLLPIKYGGV